jgi:4-hydroxymandelate oxidase
VRFVLPLLADHQRRAEQVLRAEVHDYYAGGAGEEVSLEESVASWRSVRLRPRVLRDVTRTDTSLELLGARLATPVLVAPTALQGLAHRDGERATAAGAAAAGSLTVVSTRSSTALEEVAAPGPWWFQSYVMRDRALSRALAERAAATGAGAIVLTGDTPYVGRKKRGGVPGGVDPLVNLAQHLASGDDGGVSTEQDPSAGLEAIAELRSASGLPVLVKGVLRGDDALACLDSGAAGIVVSNHGGRQLDRAVATASALPDVAAAVAGRAPVLVDGGLRSGLDALCALALGADAVLVGRPALWALAVGGAAGVEDCLRALTDDLAHCMALAGACSLDEVDADLLVQSGIGRYG